MKNTLQISLLCLLPLFVFAQPSTYKVTVKSFTEKDGLSNNEVFCINKDKQGVLWVGTRYGLNRFDGQHFKVFTVENGLRSNTVYQIWSEGNRLWLFYKSALDGEVTNIDILDVSTERITPLQQKFDKLPFVWENVQRCELQHDAVLFQLNDTEYFVYTTQKGFQKHRFPKDERLHACTASGAFWLTKTENETRLLIKRTADGKLINRLKLPYANFFFKLLHETANGTTYFYNNAPAFGDQPFYIPLKIEAKAEKIDTVVLRRPYKNLLINLLFIPKFQLFWLSEANQLSAIDLTGKKVFQSEGLVENINSFHRQSLVTDNLVLQPASQNGFYLIEINKNHFQNLFTDQKQEYSFRGIVQRGDEFFYNPNSNVILTKANHPNTLLPHSAVASVLDKNGTLWGAKSGVLWQFDTLGKIIQYANSSFFNEPWAIYVDAESGEILTSQGGIIYFNPKTKAIFAPDFGQFQELKKHTVYHFYDFKKNTLLLCTTSGLYELDKKKRKIIARYWSGGKGKYYLPTDDFRHLCHDKKTNTFWVATGQDGLLQWQPTTQQTTLFKFGETMTNVAHCVYADDFGFLWLSTDNGIVQFHQKTHRFKIYTVQDGLPTNEFNRVSHLKDKSGRLHFGSINGVTVFHPRDFRTLFFKKENPKPFVVEVEQYLGKTQKLTTTTPFFLEHGYISVQPNDRFLYLTLALNDLSWATEASYFYKIKGEKMEWIPIERNRLTLGKLPFGWQTIVVKTRLSNGQFSTEKLEIQLRVHRPFYLQWWFVLVMIAAVAGLIFWRVQELAQINVRLNREVEERTQTIATQAAELRQLDEMKSRFFANISHELRTPLTLIASPLQRLMRQETDPEKRQSLRFATKNSQRLLRLVNEILDLTKLEAAKLGVEPQNVQILPFVRRVLAEFESFAAHKGVSLSLNIESSEALTGYFDLKKVETILYNLVSNALKFTPEGGAVFFKVREEKDGIAFEVTDTGRGIAPEDLPHVFDRFYQAKNQTTAEGGTGIGLAICKEFAKLLKGKIDVKSELGRGTSFYLFIPATTSLVENPASMEVAEAFASEEEDGRFAEQSIDNRPLLLLVEDNEDLQRYLSVLLQKSYRLHIVNNGKVALDFLQICEAKDRPALILSDVMMPEMDGLQLLEVLKTSAEYRHIPVVMLTARAGNDDRLRALRIGVDDYLTKPFLEEELLVRIDNLLRNAAVRQEQPLLDEMPDPSESIAEPDNEWLEVLENLVKTNLNNHEFSVDFIAQSLNISRPTLNTYLKKAVGMTAVQYLKEVRLSMARKLLETDKSLTLREVLERVGVSDLKYFRKQYKERFGYFPSDSF